MKTVKIFDTTLRDGEQAPGCSMLLKEKVEIALSLEAMGVDVIEAGYPVNSPGDMEAVKAIAKAVKGATVACLARAKYEDIQAAAEALRPAENPRIHIFIATSQLHMKYKLKMNEREVLKAIQDSVAYAKNFTDDVEFSAEDATRSDRDFLVRAYKTAIEAGATTINITDTVGIAAPFEMYDLVKFITSNLGNLNGITVSAHCHNDLGMAVANSLAALQAGATQVEGTINGIGERAGNAALEEIIMALSCRGEYFGLKTNIDTTKISRISRLVYSAIGTYPPLNKAVVGRNAFKHESGIHQHGVMQNPATYEIMSGESIGVKRDSMVFGKHSGKHAIAERLKALGYTLTEDELKQFVRRFKELADKKQTLNDTDLEALMGYSAAKGDESAGWKLDRFTVNTGNVITSNAVVRLISGTSAVEEVAIGDGPIDAAYKAADKIVGIKGHTLDDYSIKSVTQGVDALGEVIVRLKKGRRIVTGKGLSSDVVEASLKAYLNALNKLL